MDYTEIKLKTCPFCGNDNVRIFTNPMGKFSIHCGNCGVQTKAFGKPYKVAEMWNKRAEDGE